MKPSGNPWQPPKTNPWQPLPLPKAVISRALARRLPYRLGSGSQVAASPVATVADVLRQLADRSATEQLEKATER
jgi:hypothetical protein